MARIRELEALTTADIRQRVTDYREKKLLPTDELLDEFLYRLRVDADNAGETGALTPARVRAALGPLLTQLELEEAALLETRRSAERQLDLAAVRAQKQMVHNCGRAVLGLRTDAATPLQASPTPRQL